MASASDAVCSRLARIAIVEQHVRHENEHNLEGILDTFGDAANYDDEPWVEHYEGRNGVRQFYEQLMKALPDLRIEIQRRHVAEDAILLEVIIRGTHLGGWRELPATGRRVEFPLCGVYTFHSANRLARERIYYDRGTVLKQLGVFYEPQSVLAQISIVATHPATIGTHSPPKALLLFIVAYKRRLKVEDDGGKEFLQSGERVLRYHSPEVLAQAYRNPCEQR